MILYRYFFLILYGNLVPWHQIENRKYLYKFFQGKTTKSSRKRIWILWFFIGVIIEIITNHLYHL